MSQDRPQGIEPLSLLSPMHGKIALCAIDLASPNPALNSSTCATIAGFFVDRGAVFRAARTPKFQIFSIGHPDLRKIIEVTTIRKSRWPPACPDADL
jgi:hypothetical protein